MMTVMEIHPQCRAIMQRTSNWRSRPLEEMEVNQARSERAAHLEEAHSFAGEPEPVHSVEDRVLSDGPAPVKIRVYRPQAGGTLPALVFIHGGGWVFGDLDTMDRPCRALANTIPAVVVSVDYGLAPEHRFPAPCEHVYQALAYVAEHAEELGVDPARIAVGGDSAGGNLAAAVALMARDRGGPSIAFQLLVYPVTDYDDTRPAMSECAEGFGLTRTGMQWFWQHYTTSPDDARHPYASPMNAESLAGLPPALIITAECDPLRDQGEAYGAKLRAAGVPVEITRYDGMIHSFYPMKAMIDAAADALELSARAVRQALR